MIMVFSSLASVLPKNTRDKEINAAFSIGKILPIDTNLVDELEKQAQGISKDVETMFQHLQSQMFEATVLTKSSFEVYDQTIVKQGEAIETAIDKTKQLIELCVDLDKEFNSNVVGLSSKISWRNVLGGSVHSKNIVVGDS
nr:5830_t:CDS:2 [Entrophospora candida]